MIVSTLKNISIKTGVPIYVPHDGTHEIISNENGTHDGTHDVPHDVPHESVSNENVPHDVPHESISNENGTLNSNSMNDIDYIILLIKENPYITRRELAYKTNKSLRTIQRIIKDSNRIKYIGSGNHGYWEIIE